MAKPRTERNLLFPSKEFRERVRKTSMDRGFRSEQAFILAACEGEMRRGDNTDSITQFEARIAATLTNLAKQLQGLHTLAQAAGHRRGFRVVAQFIGGKLSKTAQTITRSKATREAGPGTIIPPQETSESHPTNARWTPCP